MTSYKFPEAYLNCKKTGNHNRTVEGGVAELAEVGGVGSQGTSDKGSEYKPVGCASYRTNTSGQAPLHQEQELNTTVKIGHAYIRRHGWLYLHLMRSV